jgi:transcriptional regulator with XRE-family HTH domain
MGFVTRMIIISVLGGQPMEDELPTSLKERLDWLFRNVTKSDGAEYTYQEVEQGTEQLGYRVTTTAIWKIRKGETLNPGYLVLQVLAKFFGVPVRYFYENELTANELENMRLAATLREQGIEEIALRSSRLDKAGRDAILHMLRYMVEAHDDEPSIQTKAPTDSVTDSSGEDDDQTG